MTVIDEKSIPLYVEECAECGSKFTYRRVEVEFGHSVICPVCGYYQWANFNKFKDEKRETK